MFDGRAESFDRDLIERLEYKGPELLKAALAPTPKEPDLAILDLGCGTGLCGLQFRDWTKSLTGIDVSGKMLAKAREREICIPGRISGTLPARQTCGKSPARRQPFAGIPDRTFPVWWWCLPGSFPLRTTSFSLLGLCR